MAAMTLSLRMIYRRIDRPGPFREVQRTSPASCITSQETTYFQWPAPDVWQAILQLLVVQYDSYYSGVILVFVFFVVE